MTSRERLLAAIHHQEPDRVPVSPRLFAWLWGNCGNIEPETIWNHFPQVDLMHVHDLGTLNYLEMFPETYDLPGVRVEQKRFAEGDCEIVERKFITPAGILTDKTRIPPSGREYGVTPNPQHLECLVKTPDDLHALRYLLPPIKVDADRMRAERKRIGDRGLVSISIRSALDHQAGFARELEKLMLDYFDDRPFFAALIGLFHAQSMSLLKAVLEAGADCIFGSWYFASLSAGWSPDIFRDVFVPLIREQVELTHTYGALYDYYDDGRLGKSMEMIAATGIDVLETCTPPPAGDFDLKEAKERIGRKTTLKGYIDLINVMRFGDPELVDRTVKWTMEIAKPGGGFIIGSSDSFREDTPQENLKAYFRACLAYGRYSHC